MKTGNKGIELIKRWEGYHKEVKDGSGDCVAYLDKLASTPIWTIGYGCTVGVHKGMRWTKKQAEAQLLKEIAKHELIVSRLIKVKLDQNQFDALVSLSYNVGLDKCPTLVRLVNEQKWDEAANAFALYNKAGGKIRAGLVSRRQEEADLFRMWTKSDITADSGTLSVLRKVLGSVSAAVTAFVGADTMQMGMDYVNWIKEFSGNHKILVGAFVIGVFWAIMKYVEHKKHREYEEGRYIPKEAE